MICRPSWPRPISSSRSAGLKKMTLDQFRAEFCLPFKNFYDRFAPGIPIGKVGGVLPQPLQPDAGGRRRNCPTPAIFSSFAASTRSGRFCSAPFRSHYFARQAAANGFDEFIDRPYPGVWDKRAKIIELLAENQLAAAETIFIGDMQHDIETAKFGGIGSCAVLTGYNRLDQLRASEPDVIVEHLGELREILERNHFQLPSPSPNGSDHH